VVGLPVVWHLPGVSARVRHQPGLSAMRICLLRWWHDTGSVTLKTRSICSTSPGHHAQDKRYRGVPCRNAVRDRELDPTLPRGDTDRMVDPASRDELRLAERRLQAAQLAGDTAMLEQLLDDRLLPTLGPTGACYTK